MKSASLLLIATLCAYTSAYLTEIQRVLRQDLSSLAQDGDASVDKMCIIKKCGVLLAKCMLSSQCRTCTNCMRSCAPEDSYCSSMCFFKYSNDQFNKFTGCAVGNKCIETMTWSNYTCPTVRLTEGDIAKKRIPYFSVKNFARVGEMFVARGSHPVFDCFQCQNLKFNLVDPKDPSKGVLTRWSTDLEGTVRDASYVLKQESPNSIVTKYTLFGMPVEEHYYILDYEPDMSYVLYFYCGFGFGGQYQGSLVYSKTMSVEMPKEVEERYARLTESLDLNEYLPPWNQYCKPDYLKQKCTNINTR